MVFLYLSVIILTNYLAFYLKFDGKIPSNHLVAFKWGLPWILAVRGLTFIPFRLYQGLWRYSGINDLVRIIGAVLISGLVSFVWIKYFLVIQDYPSAIMAIDSALLILFLGGIRLERRISRELGKIEGDKKGILIYGAGDAGEMIVRDMKKNPSYEYKPLGFIDDDRRKKGLSIHGVPILGTRDNLDEIIEKFQPKHILMAIPSASPAQLRSIVKRIGHLPIQIKTLPSLRAIINGHVSVDQIRNLSLEDLLSRDPVNLDTKTIESYFKNKRVLVTGAGGSIGSELCRQLAFYNLDTLILYEQHENSLFYISHELNRDFPDLSFKPIVGDITNPLRLREVFIRYNPHIVLHAAAHKHVPLVEINVLEAIKNNVLGTRNVADAAADFNTEDFVLISTDKAVNPISVMGATKRVAECYVRWLNSRNMETTYSRHPAPLPPGEKGMGERRNRKRFIIVRFGNVMASNGSVIPIFIEQIRRGEPVTVTHPDARRYFMLISEAVQLILQTITISEGDELFILDMGEQLNVLEIAKTLIRLSGYVPEKDIKIKIIGLRPGEKICEELFDPSSEIIRPTHINKINMVISNDNSLWISIYEQIYELEEIMASGDHVAALKKLREIVPNYRPVSLD